MKKTLTAAITTALVIGAASTTFAAANPFTDVPTGHWSYDAVAKLAQDGVIEGYGDGTFRGDKAITRYEMAQMVAKAMAKSDVSAADKAAIDKLAAEYSAELNNLGVRVGELENKVDNVKWGGKARLRLDNGDMANQFAAVDGDSDSYSQSYVDLWASAKINADWTAKVEYEHQKNMQSGADEQGDETSKVYVEGKLMGADVKVGKFGAFSQYGQVIDAAVSGAEFKFGNELKTKLTFGRLDKGFKFGKDLETDDLNSDYMALQLGYAINDKTNVNAGYHVVKDIQYTEDGDTFADDVKIFEFGFDTKFSNDWSFMANYAKADVGNKLHLDELKDSGIYTELKYKQANVKEVGSYDIFLNYRDMGIVSNIDTTFDYASNVKGWALGFDYVPAENINFQAFYLDGKQKQAHEDGTEKLDVKVVRAQVELFF